MNTYKVLVATIIIFLVESSLFSSEIQNVCDSHNIYNQLQEMQEAVTKYSAQSWGVVDINQLENDMTSICENLRTIRKETDIGKNLSQLFSDAESQASFLTGYLMENDFSQANNNIQNLSIKLSELKEAIWGKVRKIVHGVDLFNTTDIEGLEGIAQKFEGKIQEEIIKAIPPVYINIQESEDCKLYGLRKDHLLLQTAFFQMIKQRDGGGLIENPLVIADIDYYVFEEFVRKVQDNNYKLWQKYDFEANIDFYNHILSMMDKFLLLCDEEFNSFISDLTVVLKNNENKLTLLNEQVYEFALKIIDHGIQDDYMFSIGGIKTDKTFKFEIPIMVLCVQRKFNELCFLECDNFELPVYSIKGQEYIDGNELKDFIKKNDEKNNKLLNENQDITIEYDSNDITQFRHILVSELSWKETNFIHISIKERKA